MLRNYDLSISEDVIAQVLNDPTLYLISLNVSCSAETGYTGVALRMRRGEKRERKYDRFIKRYVLAGPKHPEIDELLSNPEVRLIKQYLFPTSEGTIVVLDYQVKRKAGR